MGQSMQTLTLLEDYVSINERPKRSKVSKGSKYTPEEKAERARISTMKCYYNNLGKARERKRLYAQNKRAI